MAIASARVGGGWREGCRVDFSVWSRSQMRFCTLGKATDVPVRAGLRVTPQNKQGVSRIVTQRRKEDDLASRSGEGH
jgi:hypothetical protein